MNEKVAWAIAPFMLAFVILTGASTSFAENGNEFHLSKVIGVVTLTKEGMNQNVYRKIDRLVPDLKKIPPERIVKLECRYAGLPEREQDVLGAYLIAGQVERYLREHHKINLDFWIATQIEKQARETTSVLTFSVFPQNVRNLDKLPLAPLKALTE